MIVLKSSGDHHWPWADAPDEGEAEKRFKAAYPSLYARMKNWESLVDLDTGKRRGLRHREDQGRFWWELRPCAYYDAFDRNRLAYPDLSWSSSFLTLSPGVMVSDLAFFVPSDEINNGPERGQRKKNTWDALGDLCGGIGDLPALLRIFDGLLLLWIVATAVWVFLTDPLWLVRYWCLAMTLTRLLRVC
jgi:hypothetical protein